MIIANVPIQVSQSRDVRAQYRDVDDPKFAKEWGKPVALIPSKVVRFSVTLDVDYSNEHAPLVRNLLKAVSAIQEVINVEVSANASA